MTRLRAKTHTTHPSHLFPHTQLVDYGINSLWKKNNAGKLYEDCLAAGVIGGATGEDE